MFFDLETTAEEKSLRNLKKKDPPKAAAFQYNYDMAVSRNRVPWIDKTVDEMYVDQAALLPEYGKIICMSWGFLEIQEGQEIKCKIGSFIGDEKELLQKAQKLFVTLGEKNHIPCGQNIKNFDLPYLSKRMVINELEVPSILCTAGKKPWEILAEDTKEAWSFGNRSNQSNLVETCAALKIPTPKDDIWGGEVFNVFWKDKDIDRIATYCEKDVLAVMNIMLKLSGNPIIKKKINKPHY